MSAIQNPPPARSIFLDALISAQQEAAVAAVITCQMEHSGSNACEDFFQYWYSPKFGQFGTHDRDLPWAASSVIEAECLTPEACRKLVVSAWTWPEFPEANLSRVKWLKMFKRVGYVSDSSEDPLPVPSEPVRLWRGAIPSRRKGMAWTSDKERAIWFARRLSGVSDRVDGALWSTVAPPPHVLARFAGRSESEFVLDTRRLTVEAAEGL